MLWMDSVGSVRPQVMKTAARITAYRRLDAMYGTPKPTCSTSAAIVPNTPTMHTASQYVQAM